MHTSLSVACISSIQSNLFAFFCNGIGLQVTLLMLIFRLRSLLYALATVAWLAASALASAQQTRFGFVHALGKCMHIYIYSIACACCRDFANILPLATAKRRFFSPRLLFFIIIFSRFVVRVVFSIVVVEYWRTQINKSSTRVMG